MRVPERTTFALASDESAQNATIHGTVVSRGSRIPRPVRPRVVDDGFEFGWAGTACRFFDNERNMARIKAEEIVDHLSSEMRRALRDAVKEVIPDVSVDEYQLFRAFRRAVGRKCSTWEQVPDQYVEVDD